MIEADLIVLDLAAFQVLVAVYVLHISPDAPRYAVELLKLKAHEARSARALSRSSPAGSAWPIAHGRGFDLVGVCMFGLEGNAPAAVEYSLVVVLGFLGENRDILAAFAISVWFQRSHRLRRFLNVRNILGAVVVARCGDHILEAFPGVFSTAALLPALILDISLGFAWCRIRVTL